LCTFLEDELVHMRAQELQRLGTAGFMTEFGAYEDGFGDDLTDARRLLGLADGMLQSWQYWMVKGYGDPTTTAVDKYGNTFEGFYDSATGELDTAKVNMLARPYAQAVAGRYVAMSNDFDAGVFTVTYLVSAAAKAPTTIYTGTGVYFPAGINVTFSPAGWATYTAVQPYLIQVTHTALAKDGASLTVTITNSA